MSRRPVLLALLAAPVLLVACEEGKSTYLNAKPGECYSVGAGRDSVGAPKMVKVPCASQTASLTCPPPAAPATCTAVEAKPSGHKIVRKTQTRRVAVRRTSAARYARYDDMVARSGELVRSLGIEYPRVDSDRLLGGPQAYAEARDYARSYEERGYREEHYVSPPPPPPPPSVHARAKKSERSYSYSESSSYSGGYASSSSRDCDCDHGGRVLGPRVGRDSYGYLTWPGKTPG